MSTIIISSILYIYNHRVLEIQYLSGQLHQVSWHCTLLSIISHRQLHQPSYPINVNYISHRIHQCQLNHTHSPQHHSINSLCAGRDVIADPMLQRGADGIVDVEAALQLLSTYTCIHSCTYMHTHLHASTAVHTYIHICTYIHPHLFIHVFTLVNSCIQFVHT